MTIKFAFSLALAGEVATLVWLSDIVSLEMILLFLHLVFRIPIF